MANTTQRSAITTWLFDPIQPTGARAEYQPRIGKALWGIPTLIGIACLVASLVGWGVDAHQFYFSYLIGWAFCLALSLGALFIVVIQHLTRAKWSVVIRRIPEALAWSFPLLAVLSIPILFGLHDLYHWTHHDLFDPASPEYDPVVAGKEGYLNLPFFLARLAFYFIMWSYLSYRLYTLSVRQDVDPDRDIPALQRRVSAWGLPVLAITTAFASFDLLMSLDPHWFSTIFGVYFFGGAFWTAFAFIAFTAIILQRNGMLRHAIAGPHYLDIGRFMFGFTVFWAYIA
jgi:hypothetical protein